ncbi:MAG TPA: PsiF family protein [Sphingobium sp.]
MQYKIAAMVAAALMAGSAMAQAPLAKPAAKAPAATRPVATAARPATPATKRAPVVRTAKSLDCSKQADAKGLHGNPRKSFMSSCKKA